MVEGELYNIANFYTKELGGIYKPVSSKICISFSGSTFVQRLMQDDHVIPRHKFEFVDLGDIFQISTPNGVHDFSPDLIGVVEDYENLQTITTKNGPREVVKFRITDGRTHHRVTVWGDAAIQVGRQYEVDDLEQPAIAIITSTKLKSWKSSVQVSTIAASKIYINLENDDVLAMRQRLQEEGYRATDHRLLTQNDPSQDSDIFKTFTIEELMTAPSILFLQKIVICHVKIVKIEDVDNWWYNACNVCQQEIFKVEGRFKCDNCSRALPFAEKRYKLVVLAEDKSEACNLILKDRAVKKLIGKSVSKVLVEQMKENSSTSIVPSSIQKICGKEVPLIIGIDDENNDIKPTYYYATDIYDFDSDTTSNTNSHLAEGPSSRVADATLASNLLATPGSVTSINTKKRVKKT